MRVSRTALAGLLVGLLAACNQKPAAGVATKAVDEPIHQAEGKWPPQAPYKVIGYRFVNPLGSGDGNFTLVKDSGVDLGKLKAMTVASAELNHEQVARLVQCIIGEHPKMASAACYDPHHIFVFYNARGDVENAFEVCFGCTSAIAAPDVGKEHWYHHDFRGLVRLCEEIGIGMDHGSAAGFIARWDEREKESAPAEEEEEPAAGE